MSRDEYADRLAEVAAELVVRVRDDDPQANARWIAAELTAQEQHDLLYVLAAAVPDDRSWLHLTAWTLDPRRVGQPPATPQPCGTPAAAKRHRDHGEDPCPPCRAAERDDWRLRKRHQRARTTPPSTTEEKAA